jgi:hypothetical protein
MADSKIHHSKINIYESAFYFFIYYCDNKKLELLPEEQLTGTGSVSAMILFDFFSEDFYKQYKGNSKKSRTYYH